METQISLLWRVRVLYLGAFGVLLVSPTALQATSEDTYLRTLRCHQVGKGQADRQARARDCFEEVLHEKRANNKPIDAEDRAGLLFDMARTFEREGNSQVARARHLAIAEQYPKTSYAPRALLHAARILEHEGALVDVEAEYRGLMKRYPDSPAAINALTHWLAVTEERGTEPARIENSLNAILQASFRTFLAPHVMWQLGQRLASRADQRAAAARLLDELAARQDSTLRDDALLLSARTRALQGDGPGAVARLKRLLDTKETSLLPGDTNSALLDDAWWWLGCIERDINHQNERAAQAFASLIEQYPDSRLLDDALHALIELSVQRGDNAAAQRYTNDLRRLRPQSRFLKERAQ